MLERAEAVSGIDVFVHETAVVERGASIGFGTSVWHHAHVRSGAHVGSGCTLGKNVFVDAEAVVGDRVKVQNNVSIYRGVRLDDEVFVGPSAVFTNDRVPRATNPHWQSVSTRVRRGASIGANATIVCGVDIGAYAMVAAGAVVTRSVEDHRLVAGNPARPLGWVCRCGTVVARGDEPPPGDMARRGDDGRCCACGHDAGWWDA
jgi:UDP-2-acetamido-3-amino-2,3-dideoxy-glucuronate N-acetyltransferase